MNILRVHNRYQQHGGEDAVFEAEVELLRGAGHAVRTLEFSNKTIPVNASMRGRFGLAASTLWSTEARHRIASALTTQKTEIVHFDNTFPLVSPGAYSICRDFGAAVVQTLHNYRLLCPSATFFRDGRVCEDCLGRTPPYPGVVHGCYRDSIAQTAVVAAMLTTHRIRGTWSRDVDQYIALTEFARAKFIEGGLPAERITVKPNVVRVEPRKRVYEPGRLLFAGRLVPEKGIDVLLKAARQLPSSISIHVAGDGPLRHMLESAAATVIPLGQLAGSRVREEMRSAQALVVPSLWYEGFPMAIAEAFAIGTPVIASRIGSIAEVVEDFRTGLLFEPGNAQDLVAKVQWLTSHPAEAKTIGDNARRQYEHRYAPDPNYQLLMQIYERAITQSSTT